MKRVKLSNLLLICFPTILTIIFFFLQDLVSKHHKIHNFFSSTYEFMVGVEPSRVAVFAVFHVIVITTLLGCSKPSSAVDFDDVFFFPDPPVVHEVYSTEKEKENDEDYDSQDDKEHDEYHEDDGYDEDHDDDLDEEDVDSEDEIAGTDLERRIEEFISNVYKIWGEELRAERLLLLEIAN